jgi:hypothetical protein
MAGAIAAVVVEVVVVALEEVVAQVAAANA